MIEVIPKEKSKKEEFAEATKPINEWLKKYGHFGDNVIVDMNGATYLQRDNGE